MIPVLYEKDEKEFKTNGLGRPGFTECEVNEVINDKFELTAELPTSDKHFKDIQNDRIILATCEMDTQPQPFRIYDVKKKSEQSVEISAEHISYWLNSIPVAPPSYEKTSVSTPGAILSAIKSGSVEPNPFTFECDDSISSITVESKVEDMQYEWTEPKTARELLGDDEKCGILGVFHKGEYKFDRFNVHLYEHRGKDAHVQVRYDKNIETLTQDENIQDVVTGVYCFYRNEESTSNDGSSDDKGSQTIDHSGVYDDDHKSSPAKRFVPQANGTNDSGNSSGTEATSTDDNSNKINYVAGKVYHSANADKFSYPRTVIVDASSIWDHTPSAEEMEEYTAAYAAAKAIGTPEVDIDIDFVSLWQKKDYEKIEALEKLHLGDTVAVVFPEIDVIKKAEISEYTWDVLADAYTKLTIGKPKEYTKGVEYIAQKKADSSSEDKSKQAIQHSMVYTDKVTKANKKDSDAKLEQTKKDLEEKQSQTDTKVENLDTKTTEQYETTTSRYRELTETDESIKSTMSETSKTVDTLTGRVTQTENNISTLEQTATSISSKVESNTSTLNSQSQKISTLEQTATSITSRVSDTETGLAENKKSVSELQQTATGITSKVETMDNGKYMATMINQSADGVYINANKVQITGDLVMNAIRENGYAHITGTIWTDARPVIGNDKASVLVETDLVAVYRQYNSTTKDHILTLASTPESSDCKMENDGKPVFYGIRDHNM